MSPVSALLSEGEINSGDEEKATKPSTHTSRHGVVNNSTRLPSGASSRAPQLHSVSGTMARSPYRPARSRSPYRAPHSKRTSPSTSRSRSGSLSRSPSPRPRRGLNDRLRSRSPSPLRGNVARAGDKRPRGSNHYAAKINSDPRRFKVHYEDKASDRKPTAHQPARTNGYTSHAPTARRSPHDRTATGSHERSRSPHQNLALTNLTDRRNGRPDQGSEVTILRNSTSSAISNGHIETKGTDRQPANEIGGQREKVGADGETVAAEDAPAPRLSEDELIEQRRKKREAIKAKYKTQQAPLLVQALEHSAISAPSTPHHDSSVAPSVRTSPPASIDSPRTPQSPGSLAEFAVADDEELANRQQDGDAADDNEGPSAADYDPNMDMQEDRPDHKVQPNKASETVLPKSGNAPAAPSFKKEFDMFADDEDEDMFAETTAIPKATTVGDGRALDQNLLDNWDYPDGHYRIILGEILDGRYVVQQQIGKGTFATVVRANDTKTNKEVAVKIACNNETMYRAGTKEMEMLSMLNQNDAEDKKHIIRLHRNFDHKGHLCLVFENLSADLREVLKKFGRNVGLNLKAIRAYAQQMFLALSHLKKCEVLHADLKPDNILVNHERSRLKICDLGTAAKAQDAEITPYLVSRFYRAPEVILGIPFDYAIDMWSIGCTLFELYTGRILFAGSDNNQMLRAIQECRGKFPKRMIQRSTLGDKHFVGGDPEFIFVSQERDKITGKNNMRQMNFIKTAPGKDLRARLTTNAKGISAADLKELYAFVDLLEKCLQLDPARRMSPNDALRHHFIQHTQTAATGAVKVKPAMSMAPLRMR